VSEEEQPMRVPTEIVCVDCGGICRLLSHVPDGGFTVGDAVAYRCTDCLDRWDLVLEDEDTDEG
jgi:hypothetical protein